MRGQFRGGGRRLRFLAGSSAHRRPLKRLACYNLPIAPNSTLLQQFPHGTEVLNPEAAIREGQILTGPLFSEPMRVETVRADGADAWVAGLVGLRSEQFRRATLRKADLAGLTITDTGLSYNGDGRLLRLGLQAYSLGIAYEFDPYFGLSISRVDPLPHQLEAVYEYLLKLPRVRFLLADDAGAGKTIMAGLLIRELKLRGIFGASWGATSFVL
jgi:hypothetical protein